MEEKEALERAAALCSRRECCVSEIEEKLRRWDVPTEMQERIISRLIAEHFIDETRFCRAYALDKMRYNHWGRVKIDQMLRVMGLSEHDRHTALSQLPEDEYLDTLEKVARSKAPAITGKSDYERRGKLMRFLFGRGFEPELINSHLNLDEL
ncbi:MAG: RecX family transcriptional regulator [Bacteroidaceae bacterium]|nr:RecX family transcriptional regulator [Bacteroidaceae bacterium]